MGQIVGKFKLLRWKTKVQIFRRELLFNIGKYILGKAKNNFFGDCFQSCFPVEVYRTFSVELNFLVSKSCH